MPAAPSPDLSCVRLWRRAPVALLASASVSADVPGPTVAPPPPTDIAPTAGPKFLWSAYKYPNIANAANEKSRAIKSGAGQSFIVNPNNSDVSEETMRVPSASRPILYGAARIALWTRSRWWDVRCSTSDATCRSDGDASGFALMRPSLRVRASPA